MTATVERGNHKEPDSSAGLPCITANILRDSSRIAIVGLTVFGALWRIRLDLLNVVSKFTEHIEYIDKET